MNNYISVYIFWIMSCAAILVSEMEAAYGLLIMGYVEFKHVELRSIWVQQRHLAFCQIAAKAD